MRINLVFSNGVFKVADDEDYEKKKKLKRGVVYQCIIKEYRNYKFLKLYFALINCAWEYLDECQRRFFNDNVECFREAAQVAAGHCEMCYSVKRHEWIEYPKSISFESMTEDEFSSLYNRVKDVIYQMFIPESNKEEFEENLRYF